MEQTSKWRLLDTSPPPSAQLLAWHQLVGGLDPSPQLLALASRGGSCDSKTQGLIWGSLPPSWCFHTKGRTARLTIKASLPLITMTLDDNQSRPIYGSIFP